MSLFAFLIFFEAAIYANKDVYNCLPVQSQLSVATGEEVCGRLPGLVLQQLNVCRKNPLAMPCVGLGARLGLVECQYQFQFERWNCSPNPVAASAATAAEENNITSSVDTLIQRGTIRYDKRREMLF